MAHPERSDWNAWIVQLALRPGNAWEAVLPVDLDQLVGWLRSQPYRKKHQTSEEEILRMARGILQELTIGTVHEGESSGLPSDMRFKRTREGKLYIGAGDILTAIEEAAFFSTGNPGFQRSLPSRLFIRPGKVVIFRYEGESHVPLRKADGRSERHVPPGPPEARMGWKRRPATIKFAEKVDHPAFLQFRLWMSPDVDLEQLGRWLVVAGELGLYGNHANRQGQFTVTGFRPLPIGARQDEIEAVIAH